MEEKTILIIDDDPDILRAITRMLSSLGYHVLSFMDGPSAIQVVKAGQDFNAVVCDWQMPDMEGGAVYRHLESHLSGRPFILFTSAPDRFRRVHHEILTGVYVVDKEPGNLSALLNALLTS